MELSEHLETVYLLKIIISQIQANVLQKFAFIMINLALFIQWETKHKKILSYFILENLPPKFIYVVLLLPANCASKYEYNLFC